MTIIFVSVSYLSNQIRTIILLQDPLYGPAMFFPKSACQKVNCQKLNCHKLNCQKLNCQKACLSEGIFVFSAMSLYAQTGRNSSRAAPLLFGIMHTPPSCFCPELLWTYTFLRLAVYPPNMHFATAYVYEITCKSDAPGYASFKSSPFSDLHILKCIFNLAWSL